MLTGTTTLGQSGFEKRGNEGNFTFFRTEDLQPISIYCYSQAKTFKVIIKINNKNKVLYISKIQKI